MELVRHDDLKPGENQNWDLGHPKKGERMGGSLSEGLV
jgi:hypothetical protein